MRRGARGGRRVVGGGGRARGQGVGAARGRGQGGRGRGGFQQRVSRGATTATKLAGHKRPERDEAEVAELLEQRKNAHVRRALYRIQTLRNELLQRQKEHADEWSLVTATLCGRNSVFFREWANHISEAELRFFLLSFGLEMWKELSELVHINPNNMHLSCFLGYAFNPRDMSTLPADLKFAAELKMKAQAHKITIEQALPGILRHKVPYTFLHKVFPPASWTPATKRAIAEYLDLTTIFWWIEELACPPVEDLVGVRLAAGECPTLGYGKLMERIMYCNGQRSKLLPSLIPLAERRLQEYTLPLKSPVAVLGDCSGSMDVAVRTSSIIVSLLAALGRADLSFFNRDVVKPPFLPATIVDAIVCSEQVRATGSTSPASALEPFYLDKKRVETLIVVTDEQENDPGVKTGLMFHQLLKQYRDEVSPDVFVVFISFLQPTEEGQMVAHLSKLSIPFLQCRLSGDRPDLTKLDFVLGKLSMETALHETVSRVVSLVLRTTSTRALVGAVAAATSSSALVVADGGASNVTAEATAVKNFMAEFVRDGVVAICRALRRATEAITASTAAAPSPTLEGSGDSPFLPVVLLDVVTIMRDVLQRIKAPNDFVRAQLRHTDAIKTPADVVAWVQQWDFTFLANFDGATRNDEALAQARNAHQGQSVANPSEAPHRETSSERPPVAPASAVTCGGSHRPRIGTLSRIPHEVLTKILGYLPSASLPALQASSPALASLGREAAFYARFTEAPRKYDEQLTKLEEMGLLSMFDEATVVKTLDQTRGNVDHAVALLFGEGQQQQQAPAYGRGRRQ